MATGSFFIRKNPHQTAVHWPAKGPTEDELNEQRPVQERWLIQATANQPNTIKTQASGKRKTDD